MGDVKHEKKPRKSRGSSRRYEMMRIPDYILHGESCPPNFDTVNPPDWPIVVFVNSKSGGQLGGAIIDSFRAVLNPNQVWHPPRMDTCKERNDSEKQNSYSRYH